MAFIVLSTVAGGPAPARVLAGDRIVAFDGRNVVQAQH